MARHKLYYYEPKIIRDTLRNVQNQAQRLVTEVRRGRYVNGSVQLIQSTSKSGHEIDVSCPVPDIEARLYAAEPEVSAASSGEGQLF